MLRADHRQVLDPVPGCTNCGVTAHLDRLAQPLGHAVDGCIPDRVEAGLDTSPRTGDQVVGGGLRIQVPVAHVPRVIGVLLMQPGGVRPQGPIDEEVTRGSLCPEIQCLAGPTGLAPVRHEIGAG